MTSHRPGPRRRPALPLLLLLVGLLFGSAAAAAAQNGGEIAIRSISLSEDGQTVVAISVPPGLDVTDVEGALTVVENGRAIDTFAVERLTVEPDRITSAVALLIDTSGSTDGEAIANAKDAASDFVQRVTSVGIPVTLVEFNDTAQVLVESSTSVATLQGAIDGLVAAGDTALFDALQLAATRLSEDPEVQRREIVLFTDGADDGSVATLEAATLAAELAGATVTAVSLETSASDPQALAAIADATNGSVLDVTAADQVGDALDDVAEAITSQLLVAYTSDNALDRELTVTVTLATGTTLATDARTVTNSRRIVLDQPPAPPVQSEPGRLVDGAAARWVGLAGGGLAAFLLVGAALLSPADERSARVLRRQLAPERRATRDAPEIGIKDRVAAVMDAVPKPTGYDDKLQRQLDQASWPLRSGEFLGLTVALAFAGFVLGLLMQEALQAGPGTNWTLPLVLPVLGAVVPRLILLQRRQKRASLFHDQLPDTLQMLAGSLRAGYGLMQGLENVSKEGQEPSASEFGRIMTETRLGIPLEQALTAMAERVDSEDFRWVTVAVSIQRKVGGNLAELLDTVASTLREREQVRRQVNVLSAEGKLSAVILIALPIVFALYLGATRPSYLTPLFSTLPGNIMLVGAGILMTIGVIWIRNVIQIDV